MYTIGWARFPTYAFIWAGMVPKRVGIPNKIPSASLRSSTVMTGTSGLAGACIFWRISSERVSGTEKKRNSCLIREIYLNLVDKSYLGKAWLRHQQLQDPFGLLGQGDRRGRRWCRRRCWYDISKAYITKHVFNHVSAYMWTLGAIVIWYKCVVV